MGIKYSLEGFINYLKNKYGGEGLQITMQAGEVSYYDRGWHHAGSTLFMCRRVRLNYCTFNQFNMERHWNVDLRLCFWSTFYKTPSIRYLGLYISMDSLTLTLASFNQRYLAEAQDNINVLLKQMKSVT